MPEEEVDIESCADCAFDHGVQNEWYNQGGKDKGRVEYLRRVAAKCNGLADYIEKKGV